LHDAANVPLNERQVFIDHHDDLQFTITNKMPKYGIRDSIALAIEVKDKDNKPVQGHFSIAITDDDQVKTDSLGSNIYNNLLLTSDLKGNIENPGYYFINPTKQKQTELDNLMLTQGWIGYNWQDVFAPAVPLAYQPEKEFVVRGRATNVFGKPIEQSKVVMLLNRSSAVRDTLTDNLGRFVFNGLLPLDSAVITLQARNKRGREFNVGLEVDEFKEPMFKNQPLQAPWYLNTDTTLLKNAQAKVTQAKAAADYNGEGMTLREVVIKDKRVIKDSKNLNGPGGADIILEEEFFQKAGHKNLEELLRARFGNQFQVDINVLYGNTYRFKNNYIVLYIDGVNVAKTGQGVQDFMTFFAAEDIKGIEVMNSAKYAMTYIPNYISLKARFPEKLVPVVLEITTYSGGGAYLHKTPGTYLYRPIPFTLPTQFYCPKYTVKNKDIAIGTDMRSTLHWEPNVVTDAEGKATVSFYMADKATNYTVIMEGFTGKGEVGYSRHVIKSIESK
jgi:hypothetical protein